MRTTMYWMVISVSASSHLSAMMLTGDQVAQLPEHDRLAHTMHDYARCGAMKLAEESLQNGADPNYIFGDGETALMMASRWGDIAYARLLLRYGAHTTMANKFGLTPLHIAASTGHVGIVKLLLAHNASLHLSVLPYPVPGEDSVNDKRAQAAQWLFSFGAPKPDQTLAHAEDYAWLLEQYQQVINDTETIKPEWLTEHRDWPHLAFKRFKLQ